MLSLNFRLLKISYISDVIKPKLHHTFRGWKTNFDIPQYLEEVQFPKEKRKLPLLPKQPTFTDKPIIYTKMKKVYRGRELVHNNLIYKQFALQATESGEIAFGHLEVIRGHINRNIREDRMFAAWRIDAPWKPKYYRGVGKTLGGGKSGIDHYVTPVKMDRIIFELGGYLNWQEAYKIILQLVKLMPFRSRFVSEEMLLQEQKIDKYIEENNVNPFNLDHCLKNNLLNCQSFIPQYAKYYGHKYK